MGQGHLFPWYAGSHGKESITDVHDRGVDVCIVRGSSHQVLHGFPFRIVKHSLLQLIHLDGARNASRWFVMLMKPEVSENNLLRVGIHIPAHPRNTRLKDQLLLTPLARPTKIRRTYFKEGISELTSQGAS